MMASGPRTIGAAGLAILAGSTLILVYLWHQTRPAPIPAVADLGWLIIGTPDDGARAFPGLDEPARAWPPRSGQVENQFGEYWLFAGQVENADGLRFGFQLAFLRTTLSAQALEPESAWASRGLWRAHLVIEPHDGPPLVVERVGRSGLDLAGAGEDPASAWVRDWTMELAVDGRSFLLHAGGLDLRMEIPAGAPVDFYGAGYRGQWLPAALVAGELALDGGDAMPVAGTGLVERAWGRYLPFGRGQMAFNRLWLTLKDGSAIRCRQLRRRAGGGTPVGECLVKRPGSAVEVYERRRIGLEPDPGGWRSLDGVWWPLGWSLDLNGENLPLRIRPMAEPRRLFAVPLWSGIVDIEGGPGGWGLLELSNYRESRRPEF